MNESPSVEVKVMDPESYFGLLESLLDEGKDVEMTPKGNSMLPFIRGGRDSVLLTKPSKPLESGDIVLFKVNGHYVMHRILEVNGDRLLIMGDGNIGNTESCGVGDVIGLVTEIHKPGGKIVKPGKARFWRRLRPIRRIILAFYKLLFL